MTEFWLNVLRHPGFWPNFLALGKGLGDKSLARVFGPFDSWSNSLDATTARLFGLDAQFQDQEASRARLLEAQNPADFLLNAIANPEPSPPRGPSLVLELAMHGGYAVRVEFREVNWVDYRLSHPSRDSTLRLGTIGADSQGPMLRWKEVIRLGNQVHSPELRQWACLLLCVCASPSEECSLGKSRAWILEALDATGLVAAEQAPGVAKLMLSGWKSRGNPKWRHDPSFGWVNDGPCSLRNPRVISSDADGELHRDVHWSQKDWEFFRGFTEGIS